MIVDVIIPSKTSPCFYLMTKKCIDSLRDSESSIKFNVVLVESEKEAPFHAGQDATIMWEPALFNYHGALNLGIAATSNAWVVLANNDLIFHKNWMTEILRAHEKFPDVKAFSSWNGHGGWHECRLGETGADLMFGYRIGYEAVPWCIVIKRELLAQITLSEEVRFWYSDNNYLSELRRLGQRQALVRSSKVDHLGSLTIANSEDLYDLTLRQQTCFYNLGKTPSLQVTTSVSKCIAQHAQECATVCEIGLRGNTAALCSGLAERRGIKSILCVDVSIAYEPTDVLMWAKDAGIACSFLLHKDPLLFELPRVDLLLIDTVRCYGYLKRMLAAHHKSVAKYIIIPSTEYCGVTSDILNIARPHISYHMRRLGYSLEEVTQGLTLAIDEFLSGHPEWECSVRLKDNDGLTVLSRREIGT